VRVLRTRCPQNGVLRVAQPFAEPSSRFSREFEERTISTILACQTAQGASDRLRISWEEARGIMERAVERGLGRREAEVPRRCPSAARFVGRSGALRARPAKAPTKAPER